MRARGFVDTALSVWLNDQGRDECGEEWGYAGTLGGSSVWLLCEHNDAVGGDAVPAGGVLDGMVRGKIYFCLLRPGARRASMRFLDRLRPGRSSIRRWWETYRHMVEFGFLLLDRALILKRASHGFTVSCDGLENLTRPAALSGGVVMLSAHFGNAEISMPYMGKMGLEHRIHIVMYQREEDATERFHLKNRHQMAKMAVISTTNPLAAGVKIIGALRKGDLVAIRADRVMQGKRLRAALLGEEVELPAGPFVAAALSGSPVVSVYTCRLGYRKYACMISPMRHYGEDQPGTRDARIERAARDYAENLDMVIRKYPYQWGNFYDVWEVEQATLP